MANQSERLVEDLTRLVADIQRLTKALYPPEEDEKGGHADLATLLDSARLKTSQMRDSLSRSVREADQQVRENAWKSIAIAAAAAFVVGILVGRQR